MISSLKLRFLSGYAFGSKQPTLLVTVRFHRALSLNTSEFDRAMADMLGDPSWAAGLPEAGDEGLLHRLIRISLLVQQGQRIPVFGSGHIMAVRSDDKINGHEVVLILPYIHPEASRQALLWAVKAVNGKLLQKSPPSSSKETADALRECRKQLRTHALPGINAMHFLRAAFDLDIVTNRISSDIHGFGLGSRMVWLRSSITDQTSCLGVTIAHSKQLTASILRQHGIPTPRHEEVVSVAHALEAAARIGFPVVVKPDDQEQGRGVYAGLKDPQALKEAFGHASAVSKKILVEKHQEGQDYRLTVFRGQVVKVIHRSPGAVWGDGKHTVSELVKLAQNTPRHRRVLVQQGRRMLDLDAEAIGLLAEKNHRPDTIPSAGEWVVLRRKSNISAGGVQTLVPLDSIHPDNLDLAVRACEAIRLDLCGVDLLIPDISRSWLETGASVIELNAQPQIGIDLDPGQYGRILTDLGQGQWKIPLQLVISESLALMPTPDEQLALCGAAGGIASPAGVWLSGKRIVSQPSGGFEAAQTLLLQRTTQSALCCMTLKEVLDKGLPAPHFDRIFLLTSPSSDEATARRWTRLKSWVQRHAGEVKLASKTIRSRPVPMDSKVLREA